MLFFVVFLSPFGCIYDFPAGRRMHNSKVHFFLWG
jgi:hypothetical protein